jgi:hypothetical protein
VEVKDEASKYGEDESVTRSATREERVAAAFEDKQLMEVEQQITHDGNPKPKDRAGA